MWLIRWYRGKEEVKRRTEAWFDSWRGPIRFDMSDLKPSVSADSAFCHSRTTLRRPTRTAVRWICGGGRRLVSANEPVNGTSLTYIALFRPTQELERHPSN